jgi:hypothetical protein
MREIWNMAIAKTLPEEDLSAEQRAKLDELLTYRHDMYIRADVATNKLAYDHENKEIVLVTNGTCVLDHSSRGNFAESHKTCGCRFEAFEAIAPRVCGVHIDNGRPIMAWVYKHVRDEHLTPCEGMSLEDFLKLLRQDVTDEERVEVRAITTPDEFAKFLMRGDRRKPEGKYWIGRVSGYFVLTERNLHVNNN